MMRRPGRPAPPTTWPNRTVLESYWRRSGDWPRRREAPDFLLPAHFHGDGRNAVRHAHLLRHRAQGFLPELDGVPAGGDVVEEKLSLIVGDRVKGMLGHHHPGAHPGMEVTVHPDQLGLLEHHGNRAALRLRPIEGAVHRSA